MLPVMIESTDGGYRATVAGFPTLSVHAVSKEQALKAIQQGLQEKSERGELAWIDTPESLASPFPVRPPTEAEIEATEEMLAEIYRERDAQKYAEFPE